MRLEASDLVHAIGLLPRDRFYHYVNPRTREVIQITDVQMPEGPIAIRRFDPAKGETPDRARDESISHQMIWRVANALSIGTPVNFDRVLAGSYNTRSVLEALIANTSQFYFCYPGRIESISAHTEIKKGHKHLVWKPDDPHLPGVVVQTDVNIVISEMPGTEVVYDALVFPETFLARDRGPEPIADIDVRRRHAQIQIALVKIGAQLGFRSWVAQNDKGIIYGDQKVGEMESVIPSLQGERLIAAYRGGVAAASMIDCIWFKNSREVPAVMEVEHSTRVRSGLARMQAFRDACPSLLTRYTIVAADEERKTVIREASLEMFRPLQAKFLSYSAVEELYSLSQRRSLRGVTPEFIESFMEPAIP